MEMNWRNKKVLVTGAAGFIGSHLTEALASAGADVRALVHYNSLNQTGWLEEARAQNLKVIAGDICDRDSVKTAAKEVEVIFHLAALIAIPYSYHAPSSYVRTNIEGTLNILSAARELGVGRVVHTSTSEVYGSARYVPIDEKHPLQGQSPYSASKIGADKIAESFQCSFNVPVVTVRPFNTFGPRQSARAVIPTIITQGLAHGRVKLGNLHPTRDLNYVSNTVEGFMAAALAPDVLGETFNLGSGREISIGDLAKLISEIAGIPIEVISDSERLRPEKSEVDRLLASNALATEKLKWTPRVSLEEGLAKTIEWLKGNMHYYRTDAYVI